VTAPRRTTALIGDDNTVVVAGKSVTWRTLHKLPQLPSPAAVLVDNGADALAAVRHHAVHGTELLVATSSRVDNRMREELGESGFAIVLPTGEVIPAKLSGSRNPAAPGCSPPARPAVRSASVIPWSP